MSKLQAAIASGIALVLVTVGCGDSEHVSPAGPSAIQPAPAGTLEPGSPVGFSDGGSIGGLSAADPSVYSSTRTATAGVTLKATAPVPASPINGEETNDVRVTLVTENASAENVNVEVPFTYRFELYADGDAMTRVDAGTVVQGVGTTSYDVPSKIEHNARYVWRVRAEYEETAGPWSMNATFRTPSASIAAPIPNSPRDGVTDVWPVVLQVTNGETFGNVGRVVMKFQISTDRAFGNAVVTVDQPVGSRRTSAQLPADRLEAETVYYWRAMARDNMGTASEYSPTFSFTTSRATIAPPTPTSPTNGARDIRKPIILHVQNGATRGPVGVVTMTFEIATDSAFGNVVQTIGRRAGEHATPSTNQDRARTSVQPSIEFRAETTYHWRVIARDDKGHASNYSRTFQFTTARATPTGGADQINVSEVRWLHDNIGSWRATSTIRSVRIRDVPAGGVCIEHTKAQSWPGVNVDGTSLAGNAWIFAKINGRWHAGTYEWLRPRQICKFTVRGQHQSPSREIGPHVKTPPLRDWVPRSGETVGFMVSTLARFGRRGPVRERSNIVLVTWP